MNKRAVIYARVSTDGQETDGTSLETQTDACLELARSQGYDVPDECLVREQYTGSTLRRSGLERVREMVESGLVEAVVFYHVDRLSRNAVDLMILLREFGRHDVEALAVREPPEDTTLGRAFTFLRGTFSELERREIAERTMRGKRARAREGRLVQATGAGIFGYDYDAATKTRRVNETQADVVRRVFGMVVDGQSINGVATLLNRDGLTTLTGKRWHPLTVRRMVTNPAYKGVTYFGRTRRVAGKQRVEQRPREEWIEIDGATPAIVSGDVYDAAQAALARPSRRLETTPRKYLLSGFIRCGLCGGRLTGSVLSGKYFYYYCRRNRKAHGGSCTLRYQRAEPLEVSAWEAVRGVLENPDIIAEELQRRKEKAKPASAEPGRLERQIAKYKAAEGRLLAAYAFEEVDSEVLQGQLRRVRKDREALEVRLSDLRRQNSEIDQLAASQLKSSEAYERVRDNLDALDFSGKRLALEALGVEVHVWPDKAEMRALVGVTTISNSHAHVRSVVSNSRANGP